MAPTKRKPKAKTKSKAKSKKASPKSIAEQLSKRARTTSERSLKNVQQNAEKLMQTIADQVDDATDHTRMKAAKIAVNVIEFQKSTFDNTFKLITQLQEQSEKMAKELLIDASWMPKEGKDVVREWVQTLESGRKEFQRTTDKSFDLIVDYFERVHAEVGGRKTTKKAPSKKKAPAKRKTKAKAKKKAPAKRKATAKKKAATS